MSDHNIFMSYIAQNTMYIFLKYIQLILKNIYGGPRNRLKLRNTGWTLELYKGDNIYTQAVNKPRINISLPKWQFMGF